MKRWLSKAFSLTHPSHPPTTKAKRRQPPLALERLEDRVVPTLMLSLQEAGVNGGAPTVVATGADFTVAQFSGIYGDFNVSVLGGASHNGAKTSFLLSSTTSVQNIGASTATLNLIVFQDDFTLPAGSPLNVESGMGGSVDSGNLSLANIFQASASSTNNTNFDFTNGPQTATPNGTTFETGSATGLFNPTAGNPYALSSTVAINLTAGGQINYSDHVTVTAAPNPEIAIVKLTNGTNNDSPPVAGVPDGPIVPVGSTVTWTYDVTNPGNEPIANVAVTDNVAGVNPTPVLSGGFNVGDANQDGLLDPGETWVFTASGTATLGQYENFGTVTGTSTVTQTPLTDTNVDHYFGVDAFIQITPAHPFNEVGHAETFTITVTALPGASQLDPADVSFSAPTITYPGGAPNLLHPATATFDHRTGNVAFYTVTINSSVTGAFEVKASDDVTFSSSMSPNTAQNPNPLTLTRTTGDGYVVPGSPSPGGDGPDALKTYVDAFITIAPNATNPVNAPHTFVVTVFADNGDGTGFHQVTDGEPVTEILTAGNGASITQINPGGGTGLVSATYDLTTTTAFSPGVTFTSPTAGTVTGHAATDLVVFGVPLHRETNGVGNNSGDAVKTFIIPAIQILKETNGTNNDSAPGLQVPVGTPITWTYFVTAAGSNEPIKNVVVTDDNGTPGNLADDFHPAPVLSGGFNVGDTNHDGLLDPTETWQYTASGPAGGAVAGQYTNNSVVTGNGNISNTPVTAQNPDNYFGTPIQQTVPAIQILKETNGTNNDSAPGLQVPVGTPITWTYFVTAVGSNEPIKNVVVTDDNGTPGNTADDFHPSPVLSGGFNVGDTNQNGLLDPGETWQYTQSGPAGGAVAGQYTNNSVVTGNGNVSNTPVAAANPDNYFGAPFVPDFSSKVTLLGSSGDITGQAYFVNGLYKDILGRAPDLDGVTGWVLYLQAGGSRQQVAAAFWESPEHHGLEVNQLYETLLNREAGPSERAAWVNAWGPGMSETDIALLLLTSPEYTAAHPTDGSFVAGLYRSVLGHAPDVAGVSTWQQALANGESRTAVARSFLTSAELYQNVIDQYYTNFLDRSPDPVEEQGWVTALESGLSLNSLAEAFLASGEYYVKAP